MIPEIVIEDVGAMRDLNAWELSRIGRMKRSQRPIGLLAFSMGMSVKQFKNLPPAKQDEIRWAHACMLRGMKPVRVSSLLRE